MNVDEQRRGFGFIWNQEALTFQPPEPPSMKRAIWQAKKMMAEIIFDLIAMEGNPCTIPEIQALLGRITIGGRKVLDVSQVLNLNDALKTSFRSQLFIKRNFDPSCSDFTKTEMARS